ncbi:YecA family protein [Brevibacillus massiliensis]|nr:SEC-C metal-binding domain-containing protein [Brevibacillus massiliensis]
MDKRLSDQDQKMLLSALKTLKDIELKRHVREEVKNWSNLELPLTLARGLAGLTKDDLSSIRMNLNIKGISALKKQELITELTQRIPAALPGLLHKFDETRYKIMKKIANGGGHGFLKLESRQLAYFKGRGLIFPGTYKGKRTLAMPGEVLECFKKIDSSSYYETIRRNTEWIKLTQGMLFYYGSLSFHEAVHLIENHTAKILNMADYLSVLDDSMSFYQEVRYDAKGLSNIRVWDTERVKKEHQLRPDLSFYPFSKRQLLLAGEPDFVDRNSAFQAFVDFITRNYTIAKDEADSLVEECVYAIRIGEPPNNLLKFLQSQLEINDLETMKAFMDYIVKLHNHTRQWFIKGYTPNELSAPKNRTTFSMPAAKAEVISFESKRKVGRNDPCPCGSGKKFKKCCGR